jgi:hypothetical protein
MLFDGKKADKSTKMGVFWGYRLLRWWSSVKKLSPRNPATFLHA